MMRQTMFRLLFLVMLVTGTGPALAQGAAADGPEGAQWREQAWRIPHQTDEGRNLYALVWRPPGEEPRQLVVMTHHTSGTPANNAAPRLGFYGNAIAWFVQNRNYVVAMVHRRGYGRTGGEMAERVACRRPAHYGGGRADAADLISAIDALIQQPFVRKDNVIVVGQSTGGWAVTALAAENHPAIAGIINFAGGRRITSGETGQPCGFDELVRDAGLIGRKARTPMLWVYSENDQLFAPTLVRRMHEAYTRGGGVAELVMLPPFERDGHALFTAPPGRPIWSPAIEPFLNRLR